jgi:DNA repair protein RadC
MGALHRDTPVCTREVVNRMLDLGAPALILAHNQVNQKKVRHF